MDKRISLKVLGITYSQIQSGAYALVLAEEDGMRRIPIIIGSAEAQSIAVQLEHLTPPRPLTHDLFVSFAREFDISLKEVFIYKFEEGVFSSELLFESKDGIQKRIDSRTSDAIAFALRSNAPVFTTEDIANRSGIIFDETEKNVSDNDSSPQLISHRLEELQKQLKDAIRNENYEEASRLRDEIQLMESTRKSDSDSSIIADK